MTGVASGSNRRSSPPERRSPSASSSDDVSELEPGVLDVDPRNGADEVDDRSFPSTLEEEQGPFHLGSAQRVPPASDSDERLLGGRELGELLLGEQRVADRELPVESGERVRREQAARMCGDARGAEVDPESARGADPVPRQEHRNAELLEPRDRIVEHEANGRVVQFDRRRLSRIEGKAAAGENRLDQAELAVNRNAWVGGAEKAEHCVVPSCSSETGRASDGSSAAWSQSSSTTVGGRSGSRCVTLVEPEAEKPGSAGATFEPAVDPIGEASFERTEPGVGW